MTPEKKATLSALGISVTIGIAVGMFLIFLPHPLSVAFMGLCWACIMGLAALNWQMSRKALLEAREIIRQLKADKEKEIWDRIMDIKNLN